VVCVQVCACFVLHILHISHLSGILMSYGHATCNKVWLFIVHLNIVHKITGITKGQTGFDLILQNGQSLGGP